MISRLSLISRRYNHQKSFLQRVKENIQNEWFQNKEIREHLEKFRNETKKLEDTDAIRKAREKYNQVEDEKIKDVDKVIQAARETIKSRVDKVKEADIVKKTIKISDNINKKAQNAAQEISKQGEYLKDTEAYKKVSEATKTVGREIDEAEIISTLYRPPKELLKRAERSALHSSGEFHEQRQVQPNETVQSVELHKDSKWSESWNKFKDENPYINKIFEIKMKYDESDNPLVRVAKTFVDRVTDVMGGLFQRTDLSNVLTEICKVDPNFDMNRFMIDCEKLIIPTILESLSQGKLDVLSDWCHEAVFNVLSRPLTEAEKLGLKIHTKILDIQNLDLAMGKMMEQGPVLVFTFHAQQISYVLDSRGKVHEGDPEKIVQNTYVMAFCRDQNDLDPSTAWRLIDVAMQQSQFMF